jgi:hypothetical protein
VGTREYGPYVSKQSVAVGGARAAWGVETLEPKAPEVSPQSSRRPEGHSKTSEPRVVAHVYLEGREVWTRDMWAYSRLADRMPSVQDLVVAPAREIVAFVTVGGVVLAPSGPEDLGAGAPLAFDQTGAHLALQVPSGQRVVLRVVSTDAGGRPIAPDGPPVDRVYRETVVFDPNAPGGPVVRYFARDRAKLVRITQRAWTR